MVGGCLGEREQKKQLQRNTSTSITCDYVNQITNRSQGLHSHLFLTALLDKKRERTIINISIVNYYNLIK